MRNSVLSSIFVVITLSGYAQGLEEYIDAIPAVLQYREAYYELHQQVAPGNALPTTHAWPDLDHGFSYKGKLTNLLPLSTGIGIELGPLDNPILSKEECRILYVDHLDTMNLQDKYSYLSGLVSVDRPIINNNLKDTLIDDIPLDFVIASQVLEHVPNPIQWLQEISEVLSVGGLVALSLPDRRYTFDFYREETRPSDIIAAFVDETVVPNTRCIYDHYSLVSAVNMHWAIPTSSSPSEVMFGRGKVTPIKIHNNPLDYAHTAKNGKYLDAHCWVFTPSSFLLIMAQIAKEGYLPFKCRQFYPTSPNSSDRDFSSFVIILEKTGQNESFQELRQSFLKPLGPI